MIKKIRGQSALVIVLEFLCVVCVIFGVTYALYNYSNGFNLKTLELGIDTSIYGDTLLDSSNIRLLPINDNDVNDNYDNVLRINFNVRGNKNNLISNIIYDIALNDLDVDCELLSEYLKWELVKNGEIISNGNFSYEFDTIIDNRLVLTNVSQDLVDYSKEADQYEFRLWLSDSCQEEDISNCSNIVDQKNLLNKSISGKIEIELSTGDKEELVRTPSDSIVSGSCSVNLDTSGANKPILDDGMIAVYNDNNTWKIADSRNSNSDYKWYDYNNKMWANSVIVKDSDKYKDSKMGDIIDSEDIIFYYVWIPRYKYKVWNIDNSNNTLNSIDVIFENGKDNTGEITCTNDNCVGNNLEYLTHPSFTIDNISGFWVSKYEVGGLNDKIEITGNNILFNYGLDEALELSMKVLDYNINSYKVNVIDNLEWGSISYLTYSKYGICNDNICSNDIDSSTNNIYGVFNMINTNDEMVRSSYNILGDATLEVGISTLDNSRNYIYRSGLFSIVNDTDNYAFRNVLYISK